MHPPQSHLLNGWRSKRFARHCWYHSFHRLQADSFESNWNEAFQHTTTGNDDVVEIQWVPMAIVRRPLDKAVLECCGNDVQQSNGNAQGIHAHKPLPFFQHSRDIYRKHDLDRYPKVGRTQQVLLNEFYVGKRHGRRELIKWSVYLVRKSFIPKQPFLFQRILQMKKENDWATSRQTISCMNGSLQHFTS